MTEVETLEEQPPTGAKARRMRRRRRKPPGEGSGRGRGLIQILPQVLTTGNLAAGFYSITLTADGSYDRAALAIFFAALFDIADGRVARMARATSRFGAEYDSIADTVSFGVAPALLAYGAGNLAELGWTGMVLAFLFTACAGLRLARFNVAPSRYQGRFDGLASPAAAGMVLSSVWFANFLRAQEMPIDPPALLTGLGVALLGILMVSPIPYLSFKNLRFGSGQGQAVLVVIGLAVIFLKPALTFFLIGVVYVLSGPAGVLRRWRTGKELVANEAEQEPPEEPPHNEEGAP
jgi:CDP-diacylglycerol--serine O-phosphatidyltransferase